MSYNQCERVFSENLDEGQTIRLGTSTTDFFSLHLHHQYCSSPATNTAAAVGTQAGCTGVILNTYCQDPRQGWHSSSSTSAVDDVDIDYEVQDQEDNDYEVLVGLINVHTEKEEEEEEERPSPSAAAAPVSSWEWPRFGGTLESIVDQAPCNLVPLVVHMPDHEVDHTCLIEQPGNELEEEEEDDDQVLVEDEEYRHHMVAPEVTDMENTVLQSKPSTCNAESMTVDQEEDEHDDQYFSAGNTNISSRPLPPPPPPPYQYSQREAKKITEKRQMHRGKSSTISSNKRSKVLLHNESERKRRDKLSEKMEILHNLVPNFNKTDKASMLDQVIDYVKKLQAQHQMINMSSGMFNNNMPAAVHPMMMMQYMTTMQQQQQHHHQQQMSMMAQIGIGMGMGMGPGMVMMPTGGSSGMHPNMRRE